MALPAFNQANINLKIAEIKALPDRDRELVASEVKADIKAWLLENLTFTEEQLFCMDKWPKSMQEETGFGIGTALQYKEWELIIQYFEGPRPPRAPRHHEQTVSGQYDPMTGSYTVTKKHTWSWG
ncbi:MAG: hypothetical protein JST45_05715 [Bacteroidetes bacterium]|nr:hypothetical protein [Bacteroidota bacterium]